MKKDFIYIYHLSVILLAFGLMAGIYADTPGGSDNIGSVSGGDEKFLLTLDRSVYFTGEQILFNLRKISAENISRIVNIELFECGGKSYEKNKFYIDDGFAYGSIQIPPQLISGTYFVRAYTQSQRNKPPSQYQTMPISVLNPSISSSAKGNIPDTASITIFPEGGSIIAGRKEKIGFRLHTDIKFSEVDTILILNGAVRKPSDIKLWKSGYGYFEYFPSDTIDYRLLLCMKNGDSLVTKIPKAQKAGYSLRYNKGQYTVQFRLIKILGQNDRIDVREKFLIYGSDLTKLQEREILFDGEDQFVEIPYEKLTDGLNYLVVKDQNEVLKYFGSFLYRKNTTGVIDLIPDDSIYMSRSNVNVRLSGALSNEMRNPVLTTIVIPSQLNSCNENIIPVQLMHNPLLFNSYNLIGYTNDLNFQQQVESAILCSQKVLKEILLNDLEWNSRTTSLPEIKDVSLTGIVTDTKTDQPISGQDIYLSVINDSLQVHNYRTKDDGSFVFTLNHLTGNRISYLALKPPYNESARILVNNDFSYDFPELFTGDHQIDEEQAELMNEIYVNYQILEQYRNYEIQLENQRKVLPPMFSSSTRIYLKDFVDLPSVEEIINELVPSVFMKEKNKKTEIWVYSNKLSKNQSNVLVFIDNLPVFDLDEFAKIDPGNILSIEFISESYTIGDYNYGGILRVLTNTDDFAGIAIPESSIFVEYVTVTPSSRCFSPQYTTDTDKNDPRPDFRTVLYWDPELRISGGNEMIRFHTSDNKGSFDIIVKGVSEDGRLCYGQSTIYIR